MSSVMPAGVVPAFRQILIDDLRPTQMTVGLREVSVKAARWLAMPPARQDDFLNGLGLQVVAGPEGAIYLIDGHHMARALYGHGITTVGVRIIGDFSHYSWDEFWHELACRGWLHDRDARGEQMGWRALPVHVCALSDDPYRSLASELRRRGGYAKDLIPFSEFAWADYLRGRIGLETITEDFGRAAEQAQELAACQDAARLPGWRPAPASSSALNA